MFHCITIRLIQCVFCNDRTVIDRDKQLRHIVSFEHTYSVLNEAYYQADYAFVNTLSINYFKYKAFLYYFNIVPQWYLVLDMWIHLLCVRLSHSNLVQLFSITCGWQYHTIINFCYWSYRTLTFFYCLTQGT